MFQDDKQLCQSCPNYQLVRQKGTQKAPLILLPVMGNPFERIAMDIVGPPLQYILIVCDYATRYLKAFSLRSFTASVVAEKLVEVFSRHRIPWEILTDKGTNFQSVLLQKIYELIGVKANLMSPYHPQMDGLVERFKQNLEANVKESVERRRKKLGSVITLPFI